MNSGNEKLDDEDTQMAPIMMDGVSSLEEPGHHQQQDTSVEEDPKNRHQVNQEEEEELGNVKEEDEIVFLSGIRSLFSPPSFSNNLTKHDLSVEMDVEEAKEEISEKEQVQGSEEDEIEIQVHHQQQQIQHRHHHQQRPQTKVIVQQQSLSLSSSVSSSLPTSMIDIANTNFVNDENATIDLEEISFDDGDGYDPTVGRRWYHHQQEQDTKGRTAASSSPRRRFLVGMGMIVFILVVIGCMWLTISLLSDEEQTDPATNTTVPNDDMERQIYDSLLRIISPTSGNILLEAKSNSPQKRALDWLAYEDSYTQTMVSTMMKNGVDSTQRILERYALVTLYYATTTTTTHVEQEQWVDSMRFLATHTSICDWGPLTSSSSLTTVHKEITCNTDGYVMKLLIESNNLKGTIPHEISLLTHLESISFADNKLYGTIPQSIQTLSNLLFFQVAVNELTGTISDSMIQQWKNVEIISFFENMLEGSIPEVIASNRLVYLEIVDFARNRLTGSLPSIGDNTDNSISTIETQKKNSPPSLSGPFAWSSSLRMVFVEENFLTGSIPNSLYDLNPLEILSLNDNLLTGEIDARVGNLSNLSILNVHRNIIHGSIPTTIGRLQALTGLALNGNLLSGPIPSETGALETLEVLMLENNFLSGTLPLELGSIDSLDYFNVASNMGLSGSLPSSFSHLKSSMSKLMLTDTNIRDGLEQAFCEQPGFLATFIEADCRGDDPKVSCSCCTTCCSDTTTTEGGDDAISTTTKDSVPSKLHCIIQVPSICRIRAGEFESNSERNASCICTDDGARFTCHDAPSCISCNLPNTLCAANTGYGHSFDIVTGEMKKFQNHIRYVWGPWSDTTLTYLDDPGGRCEMFINGGRCRNCGNISCSNSSFEGFQIFCDNLEGGYNFNSCDDVSVTGYLEILHTFDKNQLSGCPLLLERY